MHSYLSEFTNAPDAPSRCLSSSCQKSGSGSELLGKWVNVKNRNRMEITRNGDAPAKKRGLLEKCTNT